MITDYNGLTLGQYQAIDKVINDTSRDELEQQVGILAILAGTTEAELLRLPLADYATLAGQSAFLREPLAKVPKVAKQYQVGSYTLQPCKDYTKLTAGQYIDFQAFTRDKLDYCGLLSVLLVPKGKAYGDGYDTAEVRQAIADHLPMPDGMALIAFFLRQYAVLIRASLTYCTHELRKMKDQRKRTELQRQIKQAQALLRTAGVG